MMKKFSLNKKKIMLLSVLLIVVAGGGLAAKKILATPTQKEITKMPDTTTLQKGDISQRITASGTVKAADEQSIFIELSQEVEKVYAELGDKVEEGQLLVTYNIADEKKELQNKVSEANITLENANISLSDLNAPTSESQLLELQTQVVNAKKTISDTELEILNYDTKIAQLETTMNTAKTTMENNEQLLTVGGVSQKEYDDSVVTYNNSVIDWEQAQKDKEAKKASFESQQLALQKAEVSLQEGENPQNNISTANSIKKQENTIKSAKLSLQQAQDNISKLTEATYSPITGTVIESNAVEGQMLTDSTVIMKLADLTNLDVDAQVSEYDIAKVQVGQKVELTSDGIEGKVYMGTVTKIEPSASSQSTISGTETVVPVTVHMDDPDDLVKPGFSFDMEIIVTDLSDASYIPVSAVMKDDDESTYVYTIDAQQMIQKTAVTLGTYSDTNVEVKEGLTETDKMITSPIDTMKPNTALADYATTVTVDSSAKKENSSSILDNVTGGASSATPMGGSGGGMPPGGGGNFSGGGGGRR